MSFFNVISDNLHNNILPKNRVWHSHNFLLPYITIEEYFIISIAFIFNLYFICFVVDTLPAFTVIVNNF